MRKLWFSNEERASYRRQALSLQLQVGLPTLFLSMSFHIAQAFTVSVYAGHDPTLPISKSARIAMALADPHASSRYFIRMVEIFISHLLGFDMKTHRPFRTGGAFGHVSHLILCPEPNEQGNLHFHGLVWILGAPAMPENTEQMQRVLDWIASVMSAEFPIWKTLPTDSPHCDCEDHPQISPIVVSDLARRRGPRERSIAVAHCPSCRREFTSEDILSILIPSSSGSSFIADCEEMIDLLCKPVALHDRFRQLISASTTGAQYVFFFFFF